MNEHIANNRELWDGWTEIHRDSAFYDLPAFRAGASTLQEIETAAVGDVRGRKVLHLQCHFGLDTLSWARMGAEVTGVDLSPRAIELARALSVELGIHADFVCTEVRDLPMAWNGTFDTVITSYGVLPWLPELSTWGETIANFREYPFSPYGCFPYLEQQSPGRWVVRGSEVDIPLVFWMHAVRPSQGSIPLLRLFRCLAK